jgi:hypothetical protein
MEHRSEDTSLSSSRCGPYGRCRACWPGLALLAPKEIPMTLQKDLIRIARDLPLRERRMVLSMVLTAGAGDIADRLARWITQHRLDNPYGGNASKSGRSWDIGFSKPGVVDGTVKVFGPQFVQVKYRTPLRDLPNQDSRVFLHERDAALFLQWAFVDRKFDDALALKTK